MRLALNFHGLLCASCAIVQATTYSWILLILLFCSLLHHITINVLVFSSTETASAAAFTAQKSFILFSLRFGQRRWRQWWRRREKENLNFSSTFFVYFVFRCLPFYVRFLPCPAWSSAYELQMNANCVSDVPWMDLVQDNFYVNWAAYHYYYCYCGHSLLWARRIVV